MRGIRASLDGRPQRSRGQFFTPRTVAEFAVESLRALGAFSAETLAVIDPAAGDGVFLDAVARHAPNARCVGLELDPRYVGGAVHAGNGLLDLASAGIRDAAFDVAVGNPPYGGLGLVELRDLANGVESEEAWRLADAVLCSRHLPQAAPPELAQRRLTPRLRRRVDRAFRYPIENLFVERFVRLLRDGGWLAVVLPEGVLANARCASLRAWMASQGRLVSVVGLPRVFVKAGASARTALLIFQKGAAPGDVTMVAAGSEWVPVAQRPRVDLDAYLRTSPRVSVAWSTLARSRWDPQFWDPRHAAPLDGLAWPTGPLGEFIEHMTYGPIVTRQRPSDHAGDVPIISQGQIDESGVNLNECERVRAGCLFDPPRSRVQVRDLLFPRSGAGSLGRNRLGVYEGDEAANLGCFVNLIRLRGVNPYFVWLFLKTRYGWGQIRRIINGVGMPNISFDEIRALAVPRVDAAFGAAVEEVYARQVRPLHQAYVRERLPSQQTLARAAFGDLVARVEQALTEGSALRYA